MTAEQKQEWEAWQVLVKAWPYGDINHSSNDRVVKAIQKWGDQLVALRQQPSGRTVFTCSLKDKKQELSISGDIRLVTTIMVVGPGYYGYGSSLKEAKANCLASGAKRTDPMKAFMGDDSIGVTGMGEIRSDKVLVCLGDI